MLMISHASTSKDEINLTKVTVPGQLHAYNLHVNEHKTEEYTVPDAQRRSQHFCLGGATRLTPPDTFCVVSGSRPDSVGGGGSSRNFSGSP